MNSVPGMLSVDIADMKISNVPGEKIITYSLGSCIGVSAYDPENKIAGLVHCMLPSAVIDSEKALSNPCMFVDSGVTKMLNEMMKMGAQKQKLIIKVAGGSQMLDEQKVFNIGERNVIILRKLMWKNNILIKAQDVGANISRTMTIDVTDGTTIIKSNGKEVVL
jgi:chemotaxis protein CheD